MKVKALRSFLAGIKNGQRDVIEEGEVREMDEDTFNGLRVHGLIEVKEDEAKSSAKKKE